jgi:hypothetical protein
MTALSAARLREFGFIECEPAAHGDDPVPGHTRFERAAADGPVSVHYLVDRRWAVARGPGLGYHFIRVASESDLVAACERFGLTVSARDL